MSVADAWRARFLAPRQAYANCDIIQWQGVGEADTPGADALCRLYLQTGAAAGEANESTRIARAAFAAFGPPMVIACADWACEWLGERTIADARGLSVQDFEAALALSPSDRYAALLVIDALASALVNLGS